MTQLNSASSIAARLAAIMALTVAAFTFLITPASAFDTSVYADSSLLASGRWVRVTVPQTGLYRLSAAELRRCGFSNPANVRVYGYGGERISDLLTSGTYIDDLIPAPCEWTSEGLTFWGRGPESWRKSTVSSGLLVHSLNPYSTEGSYFLHETDSPTPMDKDGEAQAYNRSATTFTETLFHELDQTSPGESGHLLVGEDFHLTRQRSFPFRITDVADPASGMMELRFVVNAPSTQSLSITANGSMVKNAVQLNATSATAYASSTTIRSEFTLPESNSLSIGLDFKGDGSVKNAWLDAISVNYKRRIALSGGSLAFSSENPAVTLDTPDPSSTRVWDVTNPKYPFELNTLAGASSVAWINPYGGRRLYAAWADGATLPAPSIAETVGNQNIHALPTPDMIIICPTEWTAQARRLADYHESSADSLRVAVITDREAYNEFSSGTPDIGAFRRMFKMFHDRSESAGPDAPHRLRYAMLLGRATHDNRNLTANMRGLRQLSLPAWQTDDGLRESTSYMTDDFLALLDDNSGQRIGADSLRIGIGRLPVGTLEEARTAIDKILAFYADNDSRSGQMWKNNVILTADDGDSGVHMTQTESQHSLMLATDGGRNMTYTKVYIDAYDEVGGESVIGRQLLHRRLREGTAWWNYVGHGSPQRLGSEGLIIYSDLANMQTRHPAFLYAATCSFLRWDGSTKSACEMLFLNPSGGIIGAICPTREVYISENAYISDAIARAAFARDSKGRAPAVGDIIRRAKNSLTDKFGRPIAENTNKLRYVLMADPAMRLATPEPVARLLMVNGESTDDPELQPTISAAQRVRLEGAIYDPSMTEILTDFNGTLNIELYDAERSVTTQGRPSDNTQGEKVTYEDQGALLYAGCDSVRNGRFSLQFTMPREIADNFRPATLSMYARSTSDSRQAAGASRSFYIYGFDDSALPDTIAPVVDYAYLNHSSFADGDIVNPSPMFIAAVSDDTGINLSTAGIGHQMLLKIDDSTSYNDLASYYNPDTDGTPGGTIAYPLTDLAEGPHMLSFRVWDKAGNSATHTMSFNVAAGLAPTLYDIFTDANPASTQANFYLSHNRPDQTVTVNIEVFNLAGRLEWSHSVTDRSDMFLSAPITWDLRNNAGHRVNRGIYLYRATVTADGQTSQSKTKRLAVTAE